VNIIDHFGVNDTDVYVVVSLSTDGGVVAVTGYDIDPETGNSMLLEDPREMLLLTRHEAQRLGDALIHAAHHADDDIAETGDTGGPLWHGLTTEQFEEIRSAHLQPVDEE
jgi:hypothetical protein